MKRCTVVWLVFLASSLPVFGQAASRVAGSVTDPSGGVIPSASIRLLSNQAVVAETATDRNGAFAVDVAPGEYQLEVVFGGFRTVRRTVRAAENAGALQIRMELAEVNTTVGVETAADRPVSVESESTLTSTALNNETIQALPDDEDLLVAQLQQIAGASGTAQASATLVVDGFTGGRVPSRDQIQQIIIETSSFSADSSGGPRIQIITRPGTGPWTGNFNIGFQDESLNAKNPFDANKPSRRQHIFQTTYGGPVLPGKLTLRMNARTVETEAEANSVRAITLDGPVNRGVFSPNVNRNLGMNGQLYLNPAHTFNFAGNYNTNAAKNQGIGGFSLPERALNFKGHNWNFQLSERGILRPTFISEIRFSYYHNQNSLLPATEALAVNVLDAFNGGGAQNRTRRRNTNLNFGNTIRWTVSPALNLQVGSDFIYTDAYSNSETNYLGVFTFSSLADYAAQRPVTYRRTSGNPILNVRQLEAALFLQADWRVSPRLNVGAGVRYQAQTNLDDYNNLAPTMQISYQPRTGTVLRAGARIAYQTYNLGNTEQLERQNGSNQSEVVITNPSYPDPFAGGAAAVLSAAASTRVRHPNIVAPYTLNSAYTWEQDLVKGWKVSSSFDFTRSVHLVRTRNINAPYPGLPLPPALGRDEIDRMRPFFPFVGNRLQFESSASAFSKNLNMRVFLPPSLKLYRFGVTGMLQYTLGWFDDDASAVNQYDWTSEWGPSSGDIRHRLQGTANLTMPWQTRVDMLIAANSGRPYSITTGRDDNGDQSTNDRPAGLARNSERGPGAYNIDAQFSKQFTLRRTSAAPRLNSALPQIGPVASPAPSGEGLRLNLILSVRNLLNNTQLRGYSGVLTSPLFGKPTGTAPGRNMTAGLTVLW